MATVVSDPAWLVVEHPDGSREHVRLTLSLTTIGRSEGNVLELLDPKLSRFHCEVERHGTGWWVRDCNSRNGTLLHGELLRSARLLQDGDQIVAGTTVMTFLKDRPPELRRDTAVAILRPHDEEDRVTDIDELTADELPTPPLARRRPTIASFDPRRTQSLEPMVPRERASSAWKILGATCRELLAAGTRAELLDRALKGARELLQARGGLIGQVDPHDPEELVVVASEELDDPGRERCLEVGRRVLHTRQTAFHGARAIGVALVPDLGADAPPQLETRFSGALVLHDLPRTPTPEAEEVQALEVFAAIVGRTLLGSLQLEEVRREERHAGARRVAQDLLPWLRPGQLPAHPAVDLGLALGPGPDVGPEVWDVFLGSLEQEPAPVWVLWGDVPAPGVRPPAGLRRGGERALFALTAQAELRGAVRALADAFPAPGEVLVGVHRGARAMEGPARGPLPVALALLRIDPAGGTVRFAGGGHEPLVLWRARTGEVELWTAAGPPLGGEEAPALAERDLTWEPGDVLLLLSAAAARVAPPDGTALGPRGVGEILGRVAVEEESAPRLARRVVDELLRAAEAPPVLEGIAAMVIRRA